MKGRGMPGMGCGERLAEGERAERVCAPDGAPGREQGLICGEETGVWQSPRGRSWRGQQRGSGDMH